MERKGAFKERKSNRVRREWEKLTVYKAAKSRQACSDTL